ncbi:synaptic vesicular amine transporter [Eurosta solidaginis]|uniref:synaptic vesicular amine transporter n=1 Tax=Eurosta solidaginis TaxID=178769 RepID=UPI003530A0A5
MSEEESVKLQREQCPNTSSSGVRTASELNTAVGDVGGRCTSTPNLGNTNRCLIAVIVYFALLLDNVLLTVIVPILPDYLATINNDRHHTSLKMYNQNFNDTTTAALSIGIVSPFMAPPNLAYRYIDGPQQPIQTIMTKHPIPGKSMVNFTLPPSEDKTMIFTPTDHKQQLRYIKPGANVGIQKEKVDEVKINNGDYITTTTKSVTNIINGTIRPADNKNNNKYKDRDTKTSDGTDSNDSLNSENSAVGLLLSMKALVQLIFNPIVGNMTSKFGYRLPIVVGTCMLLISSLVFSVGETYIQLLIARSIQGVGSACIGVCGMSLVAQHYPEEDRRSKVMGIILGSIALGVLLGYPFGSILYDFIGKSAPFIILSTVIFLNLGMQLLTMDLSIQPEITTNTDDKQSKWRPLLENKMILAIVVAIWVSTSTMSLLEPCLPIWLIQHLHPSKWQLGTVFIPDSVGYFVGTNFFGKFAYNNGQVKISCLALLLVGISAILVPSATTVSQLLFPHFGLGLGIGIIDAALVPLLANFVDATLSQDEQSGEASAGGDSMSSYGAVYAVQQTSVSLAYCFAPLLGGELAQVLGFAWLMRIIGFCNIAYGPVLVFQYKKYNPKSLNEKHNELLLRNSGRRLHYKKLYNSLDIE